MNGRTLIPYQGRIYITREGIYEPVTVLKRSEANEYRFTSR